MKPWERDWSSSAGAKPWERNWDNDGQSRKIETTPEQRQEIDRNIANYENRYRENPTLGRARNLLSSNPLTAPATALLNKAVLSNPRQFVEGYGEGLGLGAEEAAQGYTLGGYGWLNEAMGGNFAEREAENQRLAEQAGLGGVNTAAKLAAEIGGNIHGAGKAIVGGLGKVGIKGGLPLAVTSSGLEGSAYGYTGSRGDLEKALVSGGIGAAIPAGAKLAGLGGKVIAKGLGMTTGAGEGAISQAVEAGRRGSQTFKENIRNKVDIGEVVDEARSSLGDLKAGAIEQYQKNMDKFKGDRKVLDIKPVINQVDNLKRDLSVGGFSKAGKETQRVIREIDDIIDDFVEKGGLTGQGESMSVLGFDALKQKIGDITIKAEEKGANRYRTAVYNKIKNTIRNQAPGYDLVMKDYTKAQELIKDIEKTLSLGNKASYDTALRKLQSIFRNNANTNYGKRAQLINELGGNEIKDALAGQALSSPTPRGLQGLVGTGAGILGLSSNPATLATLPAFSPRLVGEGAYLYGKTLGRVPKVSNDAYLATQTLLNQNR